jgi:phosphoribosylanthranilate isomerase
VFADQDFDMVNRIARAAQLDIVQLSGGERFSDARKVDCPTIVAVHVGDDDAFALEERIEAGQAAGIMLDTKVDGARGGTGVTFDWALAGEVGRHRPVMVAGGLTPENVAGAIEEASPWAVDVSTGVETDGDKDHDKIRAFIGAAKGRRQ